MRIYISGKMKGKEYHTIFNDAAEFISKRGHIVVNPSMMPKGLDDNRYMPICLSMIDGCDAVVMIGDDWKDSQGALLELQYAKYQRKMVYLDIEEIPKTKEVMNYGEYN